MMSGREATKDPRLTDAFDKMQRADPDFKGCWHLDYYAESIKKRIMLPKEERIYQKLKKGSSGRQ